MYIMVIITIIKVSAIGLTVISSRSRSNNKYKPMDIHNIAMFIHPPNLDGIA